MYNFISAQVIPKNDAGGWQTVNLNYTRMDFIARDYRVCIIEVQHDKTLERGYVDFFRFPKSAQIMAIPLRDYLMNSDAIILDLIKEDFVAGAEYVRCYLASAMNMYTVGSNRHMSPQDELLPDQQIDLTLIHDKMKESDYKRLNEYGLITVGGLLHNTGVVNNGLMVYDGAKTAWGHGEDRIGILDFTRVGKITRKKIKESDLRYPLGEDELVNNIYINTGIDLSEKTVFLSLGGILHTLEDRLSIVDDQVVKMNLRGLDLVGLFYETRELIDYSDFPLRHDQYILDMYRLEDFHKPEYIKSLLSLTQSFLVILDSKNITIRKEKLHGTEFPGLYLANNDIIPEVPVVIGRGYIPGFNYFRRVEFDVLKVPCYITKYPMRTTTEDNIIQVRDIDYGYRPKGYSEAFRLFIKKEVE